MKSVEESFEFGSMIGIGSPTLTIQIVELSRTLVGSFKAIAFALAQKVKYLCCLQVLVRLRCASEHFPDGDTTGPNVRVDVILAGRIPDGLYWHPSNRSRSLFAALQTTIVVGKQVVGQRRVRYFNVESVVDPTVPSRYVTPLINCNTM